MLSPQWSELLTAYVDGEITPRQRKAVARLLRRSAEARRFLEQLESDSSELRRLPRTQLSPDFARAVLASLRQSDLAHSGRQSTAVAAAIPVGVPIIRTPSTRRPMASRLFRVLKVAVAAVILLAAGLGSYFVLGNLDALRALPQNFFAKQDPKPTDSLHVPNPPSTPEQKMVEDQPRVGDAPVGALIHESLAMQPYGPLLPEMRTQSDMDHFLTILRPKPQPFVLARPRLMLIAPLRELDQAGPGQDLLKEARESASSRFDLFCGDSAKGLDRLQAVLAARGVALTVNADVKNRLAKHQRPALTLYCEDLTADELAGILRQLATEERKAGAGFDKLTLNPSSPGEFAKLLGGDPAHYQPTLRGPLGVDLSRPLSDQTAQHLADKLEGQGERTEAQQPVERKAVVVLHNSLQPSVPREVKQLIDGRKEWRIGNVQVVFVLWPS